MQSYSLEFCHNLARTLSFLCIPQRKKSLGLFPSGRNPISEGNFKRIEFLLAKDNEQL